MCGKHIMLPQTEPYGFTCGSVYVQEVIDAAEEMIIACCYDYNLQMPVLKYTKRWEYLGDIDRIEFNYPGSVFSVPINPVDGVDIFMLQDVAKHLDIDESKQSTLVFLMKNLYTLFTERDCIKATINPLILSKDGSFYAGNSKISIDKNSLYRQAELKCLEDITQ